MSDQRSVRERGGPPGARETRWTWLLVIPLLGTLIPPIYNTQDPELFGVPFFYWYQLAVIPIGVICTTIVYRATTRRGGRS
jgi:hypothetical protein